MGNNENEIRKPFLLKPTGKDYLWGGKRLNDEFAKNIDMSPLAETWECSTHSDGPSYVASGRFKGMTLKAVLEKHPDFLGTRYAGNKELPVLVKFIDANKDLSVQVHPSDEYAAMYENGQRGKTELWYVLDAKEGATLIYGLKRDVTAEELRTGAIKGDLDKYLQRQMVSKGDVFFIEPGIIHAIGAGVLLAEIQENSNLTYRLYDYNRVDKNGEKRELHIEKAIEVARLKASSEPRQPMRVLQYKPGIASEMICRCKYFEVHRHIINTERRQVVIVNSDELSYKVILCVNGCGTISYDKEAVNLFKGDCIFTPADSVDMKIHGKMELLEITG